MFFFFSLLCRGLSLVHCAVRVVWRRIDRIQLQLSPSGVDHIVKGPRRNNDGVPVMDNVLLFFIAEYEFCLPSLNSEELVELTMNLVSNFFTPLKAHHNQLSLLSGEQNLPKIIVLQCLLLDFSNISCHFDAPFRSD